MGKFYKNILVAFFIFKIDTIAVAQNEAVDRKLSWPQNVILNIGWKKVKTI
jgi:hypothetical protein